MSRGEDHVCFTSRRPATVLLCLAGILSLGCSDSTSPTGSILVTISTSGNDLDRDPDGYMLTVDDKPGSPVAVNVVFTIPDVAVGKHELRLDGLQANCTVDGNNPRSIDVASASKAATPATITFFVRCGPKTGTIQVTTSTSGAELDPEGYTVVVGGTGRGNVPTNGTINIGGVTEGQWGVSLGGVAANCTVDAPAVKTVTVTFAAPVQVAFSIRCTATVSLQVTMATTGVDIDSDGYIIQAQLAGGNLAQSASVLVNGTATLTSLVPGNYEVRVLGVAPNCDVEKPNPRIVAVNDKPTVVTLGAACDKARQLAFVNIAGNNGNIHIINSNNTGNVQLTTDAAADLDPAWSPDGSKIAFTTNRAGSLDIFSMNADGSNQIRLTQNSAADFRAAWSPDGARIAYVSGRDGNNEIYVMNADGSNPVRLTNSLSNDVDPDWSPDGTKIAFASDRSGTGGIWVMNADGSSPIRLSTNSRGDFNPAWSPNGAMIAFSRAASASTHNIYVMNADGTGVRLLASAFGTADPSWSPDGSRIAYSAPECDYYYYYCDNHIQVIGLDGTLYSPLATTGTAYNPAWRP